MNFTILQDYIISSSFIIYGILIIKKCLHFVPISPVLCTCDISHLIYYESVISGNVHMMADLSALVVMNENSLGCQRH